MNSKDFADAYVVSNSSNFPSNKIYLLKDRLNRLPEEQQTMVESVSLINPVVILIVSLFLGGFAIDRFLLGDVCKGILKLILVLLIVGLIWVFIDWFLTYKKAKEVNFNRIMQII